MQKRFKGVCSAGVDYSLDENGLIKDVSFMGGCSGNLQGVARLVEGMTVDEAADKLTGIKCGLRNTSCPDQFAQALRQK